MKHLVVLEASANLEYKLPASAIDLAIAPHVRAHGHVRAAWRCEASFAACGGQEPVSRDNKP